MKRLLSVWLLLCGGLAAGAASSCHPDPACAPGAASKREASCASGALQACMTEQGEAYAACIDREDAACDVEAELAAGRCQQ